MGILDTSGYGKRAQTIIGRSETAAGHQPTLPPEQTRLQLLPFFWIPKEKMLKKIRKENINYDLQNEGMECNPFGHGYGSMSAPSKKFEKLVLSERIEHFGNPVLRWMLASTVLLLKRILAIVSSGLKSSQTRSLIKILCNTAVKSFLNVLLQRQNLTLEF